MNISEIIAKEINVKTWQVEAATALIDEGNTIPFIARYRKEKTGELNDEQLRTLFERLTYLRNLEERKEQLSGTLSGGEQQMLAMGRALMSKPRLMMLDEPSMGLAPILVDQIFDIIKALNKAGTTILLVEQNAQMALSIADRAYVLETGRIVNSGTGKDLLNDDSVKKAYLGG